MYGIFGSKIAVNSKRGGLGWILKKKITGYIKKEKI